MSARVSLVDLDTDNIFAQMMFDGATKMLGRVPNSHRIAAHAPFMQMMLTPFTAVMRGKAVGAALHPS